MNTLKFEVYKNTLKRRDGFNPVLGEKKYSKIKCYFTGDDWNNCSLVTGNFMSEKDNIVKSTVSLTADDKTAVFDIPTDIDGDKIYFSLTGSYADDSGNTVTLNTNLVGINRQKGMLPSETVGFGLYEKILGFYNKISKLVDQLKNYVTPEMFGAKGDGVTDDTAALQEMFSQAGINNQAIKLGNSKTYLISNTLRYDVSRSNFDGNFATIKVSDSCQKQDETYYGSEPKVTGSWSLNSVITVNIKSGNDAKYNIGSFKKLIIDCNNGLAKHGLKIENEGKTNYAHIMVRNPALYGIRIYGGNEATFSFINGTRSGISEVAKDLITGGYRKGDERLLSTMLFLGCADTYVTDCISIDFESGFLTGGADNHFNRCHAWCAYNTNIMSHSTSFTVWGGVATFSQCMIDSTKYGFKFFNAGRALINNCLNGYNQIYKDNLKTFGIPYLTYFATASDTLNYKSTNRGTGTIMTNNEWKADVIGCNFDNLGQDGDGYISVDYLPINMKNAHVRALDTVFERLDTADANLAKKANKSDIDSINSRLQSTETTLKNKANIADMSNGLASKADKSTTLAGYGISDAYTKSEIKEKLAQKLNSMPFDSEPKNNSPCYLTSGAVYNALLAKADKTETNDSLGNKADKADVDDVKAYIGYTDSDILGLQVDFENKTFTRLAGAVNLSQGADFNKFTMYGGRRRCNVLDDGTITAYYGDEGYTEDGSNGQVMVYQPAFYYKVVPLKLEKNADSGIGYHLRKANYYVSSKPKTGFKLHPAFYDENGNEISYILFSADEGSMYDVSAKAYVNDNVDESITYEGGDLLCSVAGKKPISGLRKGIGTKSNLEQMAQNRGAGWHLETIEAISANQLLMMIELGIMNSQTGIGQGVVSIADNSSYNCSSLTGSTAELGNGTGSATETINEKGGVQTTETANGKVAVTYRGVENPFGNIWKHIQGINIWGDGTMCGGQPYVASDFTFNESKHSDNYKPAGFTLANSSGWINAMGYGSEEYDWLLMASEIGGSSALPVGDYSYKSTNLNSHRIAMLGAGWIYGSNAGVFSWRCDYGPNYRARNIGGRLIYVPTAKSGDTPTKSYTAPEVDSLLATKYDSANIESGTSKLTPYSTVADKIKSASCTYKTIGDIVIVSATVKMNAVSFSGNSMCPLIDLPYKCISEDNVFCVGISNLGKLFKFAIPKNNTWLQFSTQDKTAYTFADGEQIDAICLYKIK